MKHKPLVLIAVLTILGACAQPEPEVKVVTRVVRVDVTRTPLPSATPEPTSTPVFTPTPTALPVTVSGDPREIRLSEPVPQSGAPCGVVDLFDFPLDPPNALNARGGSDFGRYRSRYNGIHAGEDWGFRGRSNFGQPVYSIGHGRVTYAQPLGWGVDQGVVIVRHTLSDGGTILSFYGHLDPPSVVLDAGDCVARGEQVGQIGDPSGRPHLHFEIRSHLPTEPGPGYWSVDPTLAGWEPPSLYIWDNRIASSPGLEWTRPFSAFFTRGLGMLNDDTFAVIDDLQLLGVDMADGSLIWSQPISDTLVSVMIDAEHETVVTANRRGQLEMFDVPDPQGGNVSPTSELSLVPKWQVGVEATGRTTLMPLPHGGVAVYARQQLIGISAEGKFLWKLEPIAAPFDWALTEDQVFFTTYGNDDLLRSVDDSGPLTWAARIGGRPIVAGDQIFVYDEDGIYRLDPETRTAELLVVLPDAFPELGNIVALPDGGLLLAHADLLDRRLIVINADGTVRWQRSYSEVARGQPHLLVFDDRAFVVMQNNDTFSSSTTVFALDLDSAEMTRIFDVGTRNPLSEDTWAFLVGDGRIVFNYSGGKMITLDTRLALEAVSDATDSQ